MASTNLSTAARPKSGSARTLRAATRPNSLHQVARSPRTIARWNITIRCLPRLNHRFDKVSCGRGPTMASSMSQRMADIPGQTRRHQAFQPLPRSARSIHRTLIPEALCLADALSGHYQVPGAITWERSMRGPKIIPGTYQVTLSVGSFCQTRKFVAWENPRNTATLDDLKAEPA